MKNILTITCCIACIAFLSCSDKSNEPEQNMLPMQDVEVTIKGDSMLYGLACDGSSDSVIVLWPFSGDPVTYNCIDAHDAHRNSGKPTIGDWVGIMVNPEDTTSASMVIDLDQLKGTWTYPVMPVMKDLQKMSARLQKRMMANMPDSIKNTYLVPREYGFTLKRAHQAQSVGYVRSNSTLESDSPVEYPPVKRYRQWYMLNGRLILVSAERKMTTGPETEAPLIAVLDTLDFLYMDNDSLIMTQNGKRIGFHRKENAIKANDAANKAQAKIDSIKQQTK
jgi:hypothetical protein